MRTKFTCTMSGLIWNVEDDSSSQSSIIGGYSPHPVFSLSYRACKSKQVSPHLLLISLLIESGLIESFDAPLTHSPESLENPNLWHIELHRLIDAIDSNLMSIKLYRSQLPHIRIQQGTNYGNIKAFVSSLIWSLKNLQLEEREAKQKIYAASARFSECIASLRQNHAASSLMVSRIFHSGNNGDKQALLELAGIEETASITQLEVHKIEALETKAHLKYHVAVHMYEEKSKELDMIKTLNKEFSAPRTLAQILADKRKGL